MPTPEEITRFHEDPPNADPWVHGPAQPYEIRVVEYDDRWPADFERVAARIRHALGDRVLEVHHVGSTSVPGLPAKPVIDVDLVVADSADEAAYIPDLVTAGFVHTIREPWWHEHRMFHDWLVDHDDDRRRYADAKRAAAAEMNARPGGGTGMDYNRHKEPVVRDIYERMFRAHGLVP